MLVGISKEKLLEWLNGSLPDQVSVEVRTDDDSQFVYNLGEHFPVRRMYKKKDIVEIHVLGGVKI